MSLISIKILNFGKKHRENVVIRLNEKRRENEEERKWRAKKKRAKCKVKNHGRWGGGRASERERGLKGGGEILF